MSSAIEETYSSPTSADDEIDLIAIVYILWQGRITIIITTILVTILSVTLAILQPNIYRASALLAPSEDNSTSQLAGLAQKFGAFTGNGLGLGKNEISKTSIALETLVSRKFLTGFVKKHDILVPLMAAWKWNKGNNTIIYDSDIYDIEAKKWLVHIKGSPLGTPPSDWLAYERFMEIIAVASDDKTGFVTISIEFPVPELARQWVTWLVNDINQHSKSREIEDARNGIHYLEAELGKTKVVEIRNVLFQLIQEQIKRGLLAETKREFILETIDPAVAPEKRVSPRRSLIAVIGTTLGILIGIFVVFIRRVISSARNKKRAA